MERVGVVVHPSRPVGDAIELLAAWTRERGLDLVQVRSADGPSVAPAGDVTACDLVVALGGDGTILKALHTSAPSHTPVMGVAYGSLGALTAVAVDGLREALERFGAGDWRARDLPALVVETPDGHASSAVNDLVIARRRGTQLLVDVYVRGDLYVRLAGDGVIVATPLGSSAYSMAAGGSLLEEGTEGFLCTPLSMHGGCGPPLVVAGDARVTLELHPGYSGFYVDIDGFAVETDATRFDVTRTEGHATLVVFEDSPTGFSRLRARGLIADSPRVVRAHPAAPV